jgi:hypothetical protein
VLSWPKLRALGVGFWLTEPAALRATAEALAKAQFAASAPDLIHCFPATAPDLTHTCDLAAFSMDAAVLTWPKLRAIGVGFWLTEPAALWATAEALAKAQFAATKDAHEPALMYAALGKKAVLQGLFRSSGNKKVCRVV